MPSLCCTGECLGCTGNHNRSDRLRPAGLILPVSHQVLPPAQIQLPAQRPVLKRVLPLGVSSFLTQVSIVIIMAVMNNVLVRYGAESKYGADIPLTVVGIVMKVFQIVISVVVGIAAGSQPIVGYNYGAGHSIRVKRYSAP